MLSHIRLGAYRKDTNEYITPNLANKKDEYICIECNNDLILCRGKIVKPYFRHKIDKNNSCKRHNNNPGESQIHKDGKEIIKSLLISKKKFIISRKCCSCGQEDQFDIPEFTKSSRIELEYSFEHNEKRKSGDVVYLDYEEIVLIVEILNTHKTNSEDRPEPWFELDAKELIKKVNDKNLPSSLEFQCKREEKCKKCIKKDLKKIKKKAEEAERQKKELERREREKEIKFKPHEKAIIDDLELYQKTCRLFLGRLIDNLKKNIFTEFELKKGMFKESDYTRYWNAINSYIKNGDNPVFIHSGSQNEEFMKHYRLTDPMFFSQDEFPPEYYDVQIETYIN